jgi:hypothetical protein
MPYYRIKIIDFLDNIYEGSRWFQWWDQDLAKKHFTELAEETMGKSKIVSIEIELLGEEDAYKR